MKKKDKNLFAWNETIQTLFELKKKADRKREFIKKVKDDKTSEKDEKSK